MRAVIGTKNVDLEKNGDNELSNYNVKEMTSIHILLRLKGGILWIYSYLWYKTLFLNFFEEIVNYYLKKI